MTTTTSVSGAGDAAASGGLGAVGGAAAATGSVEFSIFGSSVSLSQLEHAGAISNGIGQGLSRVNEGNQSSASF